MTDARNEPAGEGLDSELAAALAALAPTLPMQITSDRIAAARSLAGGKRSAEEVVAGREIAFEHVAIRGHGGTPIDVTVFRRRAPTRGPAPAVLHVHGGGMILGNRFDDIDQPLRWVEQLGVICVAVEYRLAPEHPHPTPVEDAYAALQWLAASSTTLGVDASRLILFGASAGGGIAAAVAHIARDRRATEPVGQMLIYPMLDDRDATASISRFAVGGTWDRVSNRTAWTALLGDGERDDALLPYAAPARAERMDQLPAAYVDCGSVDLFVDEDIAYARALSQAGVPCELHIWPGAFHAFDDLVPTARITRRALAARDRWLEDVIRGV